MQWEFSHTAAFNQQLGSNIKGRYGYARNLGSTPDALDTILKKFAQVSQLYCSTITTIAVFRIWFTRLLRLSESTLIIFGGKRDRQLCTVVKLG